MINMRRAQPKDMDKILELVEYVFRISSGREPSMSLQFPTFLCAQNASNLYIAEEGDRIISHIGIKINKAVIYGHKISFASMGAVCTHPDYRGKGIATALLQMVFKNLSEDNIGLLTISGTRTLYKRNGCVETGGVVHFSLRDNIGHCNENKSLKYHTVKESQYLKYLSEVYQKEPVRYERSRNEFPLLLKAMPMVHSVPYPPRSLTVCASLDDNTPLAYVVGYIDSDDKVKIVEYAGERCVIIDILRHLFEVNANETTEISIDVPTHDKNLIALLESAGAKGYTAYYPCTFRVINKCQLWKDLKPVIAERWPDANIVHSIEDLPHNVWRDLETLAHFLFDDYQRKNYGYPWDDIFPIPLPWPNGLNYI